jgi:hypothetical protein
VAKKLTVEEASELRFGGGRGPKYPWDEWLDGDHWVLEADEDFPGTKVAQFRKTAAEAASKRGMRTRTTSLGPTTIVLQAYKES